MNARTLIHRRTADRAQRFPDLDLRPMASEDLPPRDAALVHAIDHAISRRWLTLAAIIDRRLTDQRWASLNASVQAALLVGSAQLLFMERVPDHAAIDQSVRWIKTTRRAKASGLVNAVLRKIASLRGEIVADPIDPEMQSDLPRDAVILSDGRLLKLNEPVLASDSVTRLVQQTSHSEELIAHWMAAFDRTSATMLALHGLVHAPIIVSGISSAISEEDAASEKASDASPAQSRPDPLARYFRPHHEPDFAVFTGERDELDELLTRFPRLRVQDPTTAKSVNLARLADPSPTCIIDYCAGKGTKTRQLAGMFPDARIIATDKDADRFGMLQQSLGGGDTIDVVRFPQMRQYIGRCDLLVLDVPCSNTGVLARRVEARYRFTRQSLASLVTIQRQILADALPLLKDNGWLLYTTCSVEPGENRQQVDWMCRSLPLTLVEDSFTLPAGLPGDPPSEYHDGGYAAIMRWSVG